MICRLCHQDKPLAKSHIIPEFCHRAVYDERHRINEISTSDDVPNKCYRQKGIRERLLCDDCEAILSPAEKYVSEIIYGGVEIVINRKGNDILLSELDYKKLRLFQLSILWRAAVATDEFFENVRLDNNHEEAIRTMILSGDVGEPTHYPCVMLSIVTGESRMEPIDGFIWKPDRLILAGHSTYRFFMIGYAWFFILSADATWFRHKELFPSADGRLTIPIKKADDIGFFQKLGAELRAKGKLD